MIKVFTVNGNGKIEFTKAELEKLLNEVYAEGQKNCNCGNTITWTNPYLTYPAYLGTTNSEATASDTSAPNTHTVAASFNIEDAKEMSKHIDKIIQNAAENNSAFSKLARELNF